MAWQVGIARVKQATMKNAAITLKQQSEKYRKNYNRKLNTTTTPYTVRNVVKSTSLKSTPNYLLTTEISQNLFFSIFNK